MNDGLRFVIYWSFTDLGEEHQSQRGYPTIIEAAQALVTAASPQRQQDPNTTLRFSRRHWMRGGSLVFF
jgi:hypothetical protein